MSLTRIGSIGINTGIAFAGVTTIVTLNTANDALSIGATVNVGSGITLGASGDIFATGVSTFSGNLKVGSGVTISPDGDGFYTGVVTATTFSGSLAASNLTGALPAISGANLTNLDASDLASGTVPTARLGSGTASSSTFLRGDSTFATVTSTTINSNADDRVITGSDTANTLNAESLFTFDGLNINQSMSSDNRGLKQVASGNNYIINTLNANRSSANDLLAMIEARWNSTHVADISFHAGSDTTNKDDGYISMRTSASAGGISERLRIDSSGRLLAGTTDIGYASFADNLTIADSANCGITLRSGTSNQGNIYFSDGTGTSADTYRGYITYAHADNDMLFATNSVERLRIKSDGNVLPASNNSYDLGSTSHRWRNIYTNDLNLSNEGSSNDVDGTWGNYTIQEGESDLFLINKRSGKKYKFNLTEV